MSGVYDCQRGSDCTQIDAGTFYELSMRRMSAQARINSTTACYPAWTELPVQAMPNGEGGSRSCRRPARTSSKLSMCRVYLPTSYASLSFSQCPACASNESSIATITHTSFSKSAEPRSAETDWTTRILNGK